MADLKITGLTELAATPAGTDILAIVDDVAGTPTTKKITVANLLAGATGATPALKLTYTGTPKTALVLPITMNSIATVPSTTVGGQATYTAVTGPTISSFAYTEGGQTTGNLITALSFDDLVGVSGAFSPTLMASLTTLSLPVLTFVGTAFTPSQMASLTTLSFPDLVSVGGSFGPSFMAALTTLSGASLVSVGGSFGPGTMASLTTFSFPGLVSVGAFSIAAMAALTTLSINSLQTVVGAFSIATMASLTTTSFSGMVSYGGLITIKTGLGALTDIVLGTVGTLKSIAGATIDCSGQALTSASVNAILALLVSLDGTGGTITWGTGKTLLINGGTNGAPSGQGITDAAALVTRGATVTTN